jgi:hypothetical protein
MSRSVDNNQRMDFFQLPDPEASRRHEPDDPFRLVRPGPWVGGVVPLELVVAKSDMAAITVESLTVFPDGFSFILHGSLHRFTDPSNRLVAWHDQSMGRGTEAGKPVPPDFLRVGLVWPGGVRVTNLDRWGLGAEVSKAAYGFEVDHSSSSGRKRTDEYWAWPVPKDGILTIVVSWPAFRIQETKVEVEASLLASAAHRAHPVWSEDMGSPTHLTRGDLSTFGRKLMGNGPDKPI